MVAEDVVGGVVGQVAGVAAERWTDPGSLLVSGRKSSRPRAWQVWEGMEVDGKQGSGAGVWRLQGSGDCRGLETVLLVSCCQRQGQGLAIGFNDGASRFAASQPICGSGLSVLEVLCGRGMRASFWECGPLYGLWGPLAGYSPPCVILPLGPSAGLGRRKGGGGNPGQGDGVDVRGDGLADGPVAPPVAPHVDKVRGLGSHGGRVKERWRGRWSRG